MLAFILNFAKPTAMNPPATELIEIAGLRIAYRRAGSGPPLVLLHGGLQDSRAWIRQFEGLSAEFTDIAWDAPGCAHSSDPPESFRMGDYADCLATLIFSLDLKSPDVAGLSWGSGLALALYGRHPAIPRSLILASAYAGWAGSLPPDEVRRRIERAEQELARPPEEWVPGWIPELLTDSATPELVEEITAMMLELHPAESHAMLRAFAEADLRPVLPSIAIPTLLLYGDRDVRSPLTVAEELHRSIPGSKLSVMPGAPHESNVEFPDLFNAEVRKFLRSVEA